MPLQSNLPSNKRRPGTAHTFDFTSGARGFVALNSAVVVVGVKSSAGVMVASVPTLVTNEVEIDLAAGKGSELAIAARSVLRQWRDMGIESAAQLWLVAITAPAGVQATYTFTVTGTATAAGDVEFSISGRILRAAVNSGDTQNTIASAIKTAIDQASAEGILPVTGSVATNVATATYVTNGVNGNDVKVAVLKAPAGVSVVAAAGVAGTGVASVVSALDSLSSRDYDTLALCNHAAQDVTDILSHMDVMWGATKKRWRYAFLGHGGSVGAGTTLASASNRVQLVIPAAENIPVLPGELAGALAAIPVCFERPNTNYDGIEIWCFPPAAADVFSDAEVETALAGGVTPITVTDTGVCQVERLVTTKATESGAPFEPTRDLAVTRTQTFYARQADVVIRRNQQRANLDEDVLDATLDQLLAMLREGQRLGDLHKVEEHKAELMASAHASIATRALFEIPESVVPNWHQSDATHRLFVEGAR